MIELPKSERLRLEADRFAVAANVAQIAEVGLDPKSGEWYYVTLRQDKGKSPNHMSTIRGSFTTLAEHMTVEELRRRMDVEEPVDDDAKEPVRSDNHTLDVVVQSRRKHREACRAVCHECAK